MKTKMDEKYIGGAVSHRWQFSLRSTKLVRKEPPMKKLIPILLSLVLAVSVAGCTPKVAEISQETLFFQNTEWGMSKADTLKALKLNEKDLTLVDISDQLGVDNFKVANFDYNGTKSDLYLTFTNKKGDYLPDETFYKAVIKSKDKDYIMQERTNFYEMLSDCVVDKSSGSDGDKAVFKSTKTLKDYATDNNMDIEKTVEHIKKGNPTGFDSSAYTDEELLNLLDGKNSNLASVTIQLLNSADTDGYLGSIEFSGGLYASVATFNKK